jgi:hypothetical protein
MPSFDGRGDGYVVSRPPRDHFFEPRPNQILEIYVRQGFFGRSNCLVYIEVGFLHLSLAYGVSEAADPNLV